MILDPVTLSVLKNFSSYYDAIYIKPGNELKIVSKHSNGYRQGSQYIRQRIWHL